MKLIYSLYSAKNKYKIKDNAEAFVSKLDQFEALLGANEGLSDEDFCVLIYGKKKITPGFKSLKYRLEQKLMNDVFHLASSETNLDNGVMVRMVVEKLFAVASSLGKKEEIAASVLIYEKAYKLAKQYTYTSFLVLISKTLSTHYSFIEPDRKKMNFYLAETSFYAKIFQKELYVLECNDIISHLYITNKGAYTKEQLQDMKERIEKMNEIANEDLTYTIVNFTYDLSFFYYSTIGDYRKALLYAEKGLQISTDMQGNNRLGIFMNIRNIALGNFYLKNFIKANQGFEHLLTFMNKGSRRWIYNTTLYFQSLLSSQSYDKLLELTIDVLQTKSLSNFPIYDEQWKIREAFVHFLIRCERITIREEYRQQLQPFVLSRFLNSMPFYSKDKSGQNITILIVQVLFLLLDRKYSQIIDRIDALTQYSHRYLRKDESFRSNCFIKMILLMIKADFHPIRTKTYTSELEKKLRNSNFVNNEDSTNIEIIPYLFLWELVLEVLERNK